jgi:hypothetical protein
VIAVRIVVQVRLKKSCRRRSRSSVKIKGTGKQLTLFLILSLRVTLVQANVEMVMCYLIDECYRTHILFDRQIILSCLGVPRLMLSLIAICSWTYAYC